MPLLGRSKRFFFTYSLYVAAIRFSGFLNDFRVGVMYISERERERAMSERERESNE